MHKKLINQKNKNKCYLQSFIFGSSIHLNPTVWYMMKCMDHMKEKGKKNIYINIYFLYINYIYKKKLETFYNPHNQAEVSAEITTVSDTFAHNLAGDVTKNSIL